MPVKEGGRRPSHRGRRRAPSGWPKATCKDSRDAVEPLRIERLARIGNACRSMSRAAAACHSGCAGTTSAPRPSAQVRLGCPVAHREGRRTIGALWHTGAGWRGSAGLPPGPGVLADRPPAGDDRSSIPRQDTAPHRPISARSGWAEGKQSAARSRARAPACVRSRRACCGAPGAKPPVCRRISPHRPQSSAQGCAASAQARCRPGAGGHLHSLCAPGRVKRGRVSPR